MKEEWKNVKGFGDDYSVSNFGRIYSHKSQKFMTPSKDQRGYLCIGFRKPKKPKYNTRVHQVVAEHFLTTTGETVNHKDNNKENNRVDNLEYVSYAENNRHARRHENRKRGGRKNGNRHQAIIKIDSFDYHICNTDSLEDAQWCFYLVYTMWYGVAPWT